MTPNYPVRNFYSDYHHSDDVADDVDVVSTVTAKAPIINLPRLAHLGAAAAAAAGGTSNLGSKGAAIPPTLPHLSFHSVGVSSKLNISGIHSVKKTKEETISTVTVGHVGVFSPTPKLQHGVSPKQLKTSPSSAKAEGRKSDVIDKLMKTVASDDEDAVAGSGGDEDDYK
jgi:hypothetical protein